MRSTGRYTQRGQEAPATPSQSRMTHVNEIRERVEHEQYEVDAQAVARALVERLFAGRAGWRPPSAP